MATKSLARAVSKKPKTKTPQTTQLKGTVKNEAGGYTFKVDDWTRLDRFLILGSEGGTYYASEQKLTKENAKVVIRCAKEDGLRTVARIKEISLSGRAPRNDAALLALALTAKEGNEDTKHAAYLALPAVARIATHLFSFAEFIEALGGWGHGARRAVARWYQEKNPDGLALQLVKYRNRNGWSHRDLLRLSHPKPVPGDSRGWSLRWAVGKEPEMGEAPRYIEGFEKAQKSPDVKTTSKLIAEYNLPREAVLTEHLDSIPVWEALLVDMPMTAMVRNLGNMSKVGLLKPMSDASKKVIETLHDADKIKAARVHPMQLLLALRTYQSGHGLRGKGQWSAVPQVCDALDDAFYVSFGNVPVTNKKFLLAVDTSGSMHAPVSGFPITAAEAGAAMALITLKVEPNAYVLGFHTHAWDPKVSANMRIDQASAALRAQGGGTDCAIPFEWAEREKLNFDVIEVFTDTETWAGRQHPVQALASYRKAINAQARAVNVAMTAVRGSINDQLDPLSLECIGLDTNTASIIASFAAGDF